MPKPRPIKLYFYECSTSVEAKMMFQGFQSWYKRKVRPIIDSKNQKPKIQMTHLEVHGNIVHGIIRKYHPEKGLAIAELDNTSSINKFKERTVNMKPRESMIGKTHFFYDHQRQLLLYELNGKGVLWERFSDYVSQLAKSRVELTPVLTQESYKPIKSREWRLIRLEFKISGATAMVMSKKQGYDWWEKLAKIFPVTPGGAMALVLFGNKKSPLDDGVFDIVLSLLEYHEHDKSDRVIAKFFDPENNATHEVDLINNRLKDEVSSNEVAYMTQNDGQFDKARFYEIMERKMSKIKLKSRKT